MTRLGDCILLMLDCIQYDGLMQRHQHMAREMSEFLPVVYVEETPSTIKSVLDGKIFDPSLRDYKKGLQEIGENLFLYKAPPCVPRSSGYRRAMEGTARKTASRLIPHLPDGKRVITWMFSPASYPSVGLYDEILSVFDYFDAFGEFPGEEKYREKIIEAVGLCASGADLVIATNRELREKIKEYNSDVEIVQNGCDPEHFLSGGTEPSVDDLVIDIDALPRPIIGYMGDIASWLEFEFLMHIAEKHPDWSVVLIGTWKRDKSPPRQLSNVYIPGRVSYDVLPWYASRFDVCTIPFELTDLTRVVNPIKLYEYFAMGKPVVATGLPEIAAHEDLVYIATGQDEFLALSEVAVKEKPDSPLVDKRRGTALENSWKARGIKVRDILDEKLRLIK